MKLRMILSFLSLMILSSPSFGLSLQTQATKFEAANYQGRTLGLNLGHVFQPFLQPSLGVSDFSRDYSGGANIQENTYSLGLVSIFSSSIYTEANFSFTPDAIIAALETGDVTGHWVVGSSDFGLKLGYSHYVNSKAGVVVPSVYQEFSEKWASYFAAYVVRTDSFLTSGQVKILYALSEQHKIAINGSGGRTLEDAGIEADFKSLGFEYTFKFARYSIGLAQSNYWSTLRGEKSYSLVLGFR